MLQLRRDAYGTPLEVAMFVMFLVALTGVAFSSAYVGQPHSEFHRALQRTFTVPALTTSVDFWKYLEPLILDELLPPQAHAPGYFADDRLQLLGHIQLRQLRVQAADCAAVTADVAGIGSGVRPSATGSQEGDSAQDLPDFPTTHCFPYFAESLEDQVSIPLYAKKAKTNTLDRNNVTTLIQWRPQPRGGADLGESRRHHACTPISPCTCAAPCA